MEANSKLRRRHSAAFKAQVLTAGAEPEASVAAVALSFKLNDNLVHQWRRGRGAGPRPGAASMAVAESAPQFIALSLLVPAPPPPTASPSTPMAAEVATGKIRLELKRGAIGVSVTWPISAAAECAAWLREVLR
jgi:transposase